MKVVTGALSSLRRPIPLKQGLRQGRWFVAHFPNWAQKAYSIKTRIKTIC